MQPASEASMPEAFIKYDEVWEVFVGNSKEPYILDEKEYAILSEAIMKGFRGSIQFQNKLINTTYVQSSFRKSRKLKEQFRLTAPAEEPYREPTPEEWERRSKIIAEIKKKIGTRTSQDSQDSEDQP